MPVLDTEVQHSVVAAQQDLNVTNREQTVVFSQYKALLTPTDGEQLLVITVARQQQL